MWINVVNQEYMKRERYHGRPTVFPHNDAEALEMGWTALEWEWFKEKRCFKPHKYIQQYHVFETEWLSSWANRAMDGQEITFVQRP